MVEFFKKSANDNEPAREKALASLSNILDPVTKTLGAIGAYPESEIPKEIINAIQDDAIRESNSLYEKEKNIGKDSDAKIEAKILDFVLAFIADKIQERIPEKDVHQRSQKQLLTAKWNRYMEQIV